jgi:hypothetical protein
MTELQIQILNRICEILDVPTELGLKDPCVLELCTELDHGSVVYIDSKNQIISCLHIEMQDS